MAKNGKGNRGSFALHSKEKKEMMKSLNLVCLLCSKTFHTKKGFEDHQNVNHTDCGTCSICKRRFKSKSTFTEHLGVEGCKNAKYHK